MTFLKALQHAFIGYKIRRRVWNKNLTLVWDHSYGILHFMDGTFTDVRYKPEQPEDLKEDWDALDWEVI
jgi:hypothetical protein